MLTNLSDTLFSLGSLVYIGRILLLLLPHWKYTKNIVIYGVVLTFAVLYTIAIYPLLTSFDLSVYSSIENIRSLFNDDRLLVAGWIHYLAFDLLIGLFIVEKSKKENIPRLIYTLCLPIVLLFGPLGFLIYVIMNGIFKMTKIKQNKIEKNHLHQKG